MSRKKLSIQHFYAQFHGAEHHNDPGDYVKPKHYLHNPELAKKHKGLDLRALRNAKRKRPVTVHKNTDTMRYEMTMRRKG